MPAKIRAQHGEPPGQPCGDAIPTARIGTDTVDKGHGRTLPLRPPRDLDAVGPGEAKGAARRLRAQTCGPQLRAFHISRKRGISSPIQTWFITLLRIAAYSAEKNSDT
ncbi:MAG: hypothetical protein OHK0024_14830 [Thalassobaculales bacterium]